MLHFPDQIEYHQLHFPQDQHDDEWLPVVGSQGWTIVGHDIYLKHDSEIAALKQHGIGCFRLWGARAKRWQKLQCFFRAYDQMVMKAATTPRPFIYEIDRLGRLKLVPIP